MKRIAFAVLGATLLLSTALLAQTLAPEKPGVDAAQKWLSLVDQEKYAESWTTAAAYFKNAITQARWDESLQGVRKPLGKLVSRTVKTKTPQATLPGAPDGEYVVVVFDTSFEKKKVAVETVTASKEKDGAWRICGYYIK